MNSPPSHTESWTQSHLFTLRVWYEVAGTDQPEVRMQVKHVLTGETRYFREWAALTTYVGAKLDAPDPEA